MSEIKFPNTKKLLGEQIDNAQLSVYYEDFSEDGLKLLSDDTFQVSVDLFYAFDEWETVDGELSYPELNCKVLCKFKITEADDNFDGSYTCVCESIEKTIEAIQFIDYDNDNWNRKAEEVSLMRQIRNLEVFMSLEYDLNAYIITE